MKWICQVTIVTAEFARNGTKNGIQMKKDRLQLEETEI